MLSRYLCRSSFARHAQWETTKAVYLAPVADLQLRSLLADFVPAGGPVSEQELTALFARLAGRARASRT